MLFLGNVSSSSEDDDESENLSSDSETPSYDVVYHDTVRNIDFEMDSDDLSDIELFHSKLLTQSSNSKIRNSKQKNRGNSESRSEGSDSDESLINIGRERKKKQTVFATEIEKNSNNKKLNRKQKLSRTEKKKKSTVNDSLTVYCICRSTEESDFMVACDICEEWFHGLCVNVTPTIERNPFYCPNCQKSRVFIAGKRPKANNEKKISSIDLKRALEVKSSPTSKNNNNNTQNNSSKLRKYPVKQENEKKKSKNKRKSIKDDSDDDSPREMSKEEVAATAMSVLKNEIDNPQRSGLGKGKGLPSKRSNDYTKSSRMRGRSPFEVDLADDICPVCEGECTCTSQPAPIIVRRRSDAGTKKNSLRENDAKWIIKPVDMKLTKELDTSHSFNSDGDDDESFDKSLKLKSIKKNSISTTNKKRMPPTVASIKSNKPHIDTNRKMNSSLAKNKKKNPRSAAEELKLQKSSEDLEDGMEYLIDIEGDEDERIVAVGAIAAAVAAVPPAMKRPINQSYGGKGRGMGKGGKGLTTRRYSVIDSDNSSLLADSSDVEKSSDFESDISSRIGIDIDDFTVEIENDNLEPEFLEVNAHALDFSDDEISDDIEEGIADEDEIMENFIAEQIFWGDEEIEDEIDIYDQNEEDFLALELSLSDASEPETKFKVEKNEDKVSNFTTFEEMEDVGVVVNRNEINDSQNSTRQIEEEDADDAEEYDVDDVEVAEFLKGFQNSLNQSLDNVNTSKVDKEKNQSVKLTSPTPISSGGGKPDDGAQCLSFDIKKTHLGPNGEIITTTKSLTLQMGPQQLARIISPNSKQNGRKKSRQSKKESVSSNFPGMNMQPMLPSVPSPFAPFLPFPIPSNNQTGTSPPQRPPFPINFPFPPSMLTSGPTESATSPNSANQFGIAAMSNFLKNIANGIDPNQKFQVHPQSYKMEAGINIASSMPQNTVPHTFIPALFPIPANTLNNGPTSAARINMFPPSQTPIMSATISKNEKDGLKDEKEQEKKGKEELKSKKKKGKGISPKDREFLPPFPPFPPPPEFVKMWEDMAKGEATNMPTMGMFPYPGMFPSETMAAAYAAAMWATLASTATDKSQGFPLQTNVTDPLALLFGNQTTSTEVPTSISQTHTIKESSISSEEHSLIDVSVMSTPISDSEYVRTPQSSRSLSDSNILTKRKRRRGNSIFDIDISVEPTISIDELVDTDQLDDDAANNNLNNYSTSTPRPRLFGARWSTLSKDEERLSSKKDFPARVRRSNSGWSREYFVADAFLNEPRISTPPPVSPIFNEDPSTSLPEVPSSVVRGHRRTDSSVSDLVTESSSFLPISSPSLRPMFDLDYMENNSTLEDLRKRKRKSIDTAILKSDHLEGLDEWDLGDAALELKEEEDVKKRMKVRLETKLLKVKKSGTKSPKLGASSPRFGPLGVDSSQAGRKNVSVFGGV
ncbi:CXXC-type zinc finger protein 1 [Nowakowskiella sp. JEL0078]|nr:CXXC-type zinc finger protein 1 [Nowakowskiella sp. JEL0078]